MRTSAGILLLGITVLSSASSSQSEWQRWKQKYGKVYLDETEEAKAHAVWLRHRDFVQSRNNRADVTYTLALNGFSDQVKPNSYLHLSNDLYYTPEITSNFFPRAPPSSFDWRDHGVVSPVRNQGMMGDPEAFAVTDDLESLHAIKTGKLISLSIAEVADCCSVGQGMLVSNIFECIARHGGLCSESAYPSTSGLCKNNSCSAAAKDANTTVHIPPGDEDQMVKAVLQRPLVVYIDASLASFQLYSSGIYSDSSCSQTLDHALLLVGYGQDAQGKLFWILKNSWGVDWGMKGYILLQRGVNMCGVAEYAYYPQ